MSTSPTTDGAGLGDMLRRNGVRFREVAAYVEDGVSITHGDLAAGARDLAAGLALRGIRRGDRVAVLGGNSIAYGEVYAACFLAGYVAATVNFRLSGTEMAMIISHSGSRVLVFDPAYAEVVDGIRSDLADELILVSMGESPSGCEETADIRSAGVGVELTEIGTADDLGCLIYTSGTTGKPKGCMIGQRELAFIARTMNREMRAGSTDTALIVMPMFHIGALAIILGVHAGGGTVLLQRMFDPHAAVDTIIAGRVTILHFAPTMLDAVVSEVVTTDQSMDSVQTVVYSAAPITARVLHAALEAMPSAGFVNLYGQTEVITSGLPREFHRGNSDSDLVRLRSVGFPFPETEVRVVDESGVDLDPGSSGEILVRSPGTARGYWNDSAATAATFRDGWCRTGDIGRFDTDGLLYLVDRKKDVIITGGENVASVEVEDVLSVHPDVVECAVVGVSDDTWGEAVAVVAVVRAGSELELAALRDFVSTRIARYKAPRRLYVVDEIPKLPTGKIDKKLIRAQLSTTAAQGGR